MTRLQVYLTALTLTALPPGPAHAQTAPAPASREADTQASEARRLAAQARATYPPGSATIDQPLWKAAAATADRAAQAAPNDPGVLRLRAQIYTEVGFWAAAQDAWNAYFRAAPALASGPDAKQAALVQYNLGYAAYTRNLPDQAARAFAACQGHDPQNAECAAWSARVALESGQSHDHHDGGKENNKSNIAQ